MIPALLIAIVLGTAFVQALIVEARRTSWSVLEALIAVNLLGHVIAFPIFRVLKQSNYYGQELVEMVVYALLFGMIVAAFMAGGAVWVFRRLNVLGETRATVRIFYMTLGLLLFPSFILVPFNVFCGWLIWGPLFLLNDKANCVAADRTLRERNADRLREQHD